MLLLGHYNSLEIWVQHGKKRLPERNQAYQAKSKRSPPTFKALVVLPTTPSPSSSPNLPPPQLYSIHIRNTSPSDWHGYLMLDPKLNGVSLHTDFVPPEAGAHVVHHVLSPMGVGETGAAVNGHHPCGQLTISLWRGAPRPSANPGVSLIPWFETVGEDDVDPWCRFEFTYGTREALAARLAEQRGLSYVPALPVIPPPHADLDALPDAGLDGKTEASTSKPPPIAHPPLQQAFAPRPKRGRPTWATTAHPPSPTPTSPAPVTRLVPTDRHDDTTSTPPAYPDNGPPTIVGEQPTNPASPVKRPTAPRVVVEVVLPLRKPKHHSGPLRDGSTGRGAGRGWARRSGIGDGTCRGSGRGLPRQRPPPHTSFKVQEHDLPPLEGLSTSETRHHSPRHRPKRRWIDMITYDDEQDGTVRWTPKGRTGLKRVKTRSESRTASSEAKGTEADPVVVSDDVELECDLFTGTEADPVVVVDNVESDRPRRRGHRGGR